jgi:hypothetical protein
MTKCRNCGKDVPAHVKFCGACGTPAEHPAAPAPDAAAIARPLKGKPPFSAGKLNKLIKPAIALVIAVAVAVIALNVFKPSKYETFKGAVYLAQLDDEVVIEPNGKDRTTVYGRLITSYQSLDGTKAAALISEDGLSEYDRDFDGYALYLITDKITLITDGARSIQFALSGNGIAFTKEIDYETGEGTLFLWSDGKIATVTNSFCTSNDYCISPNGKIVAFTTGEAEDFSGAYYNGNIVRLGSALEPFAIADGAKYVYYRNHNNSGYYVMKGGKEDSREKLGDNVSIYWLNRDLSQIVYSYDSKAYISRNGGQKDPLSGMAINFLLPGRTARNYRILGVGSFSDTFYYSSNGAIIHINSKFEADSVARNINSAQLANDGKTVFYEKNDGIYSIDGSKVNAAAVNLVDDDAVRDFIATADGKAIYFLNDDDEVYYQKGKGKPVFVGADWDGSWAMFKGNQLFYVSDGELYSSAGERGKIVSGLAGDVISVSGGSFSLTVETKEGSERLIYRSRDGKSFEMID